MIKYPGIAMNFEKLDLDPKLLLIQFIKQKNYQSNHHNQYK
jgi:hypothetical protein